MVSELPFPSDGIIKSVEEADKIISWVDDILIGMLEEMAATADAVVDGMTLAAKTVYQELRSELYKKVNKIGRDVSKVVSTVDARLPSELYEQASVDSGSEITPEVPVQVPTLDDIPPVSDDPVPDCLDGESRITTDVNGCKQFQSCINGRWINTGLPYDCPPVTPPPPPNPEPPLPPQEPPLNQGCLNLQNPPVIPGSEFRYISGKIVNSPYPEWIYCTPLLNDWTQFIHKQIMGEYKDSLHNPNINPGEEPYSTSYVRSTPIRNGLAEEFKPYLPIVSYKPRDLPENQANVYWEQAAIEFSRGGLGNANYNNLADSYKYGYRTAQLFNYDGNINTAIPVVSNFTPNENPIG